MLDIDHERRCEPRLVIERPCKIFDPRARKYVAGCTRDVAPGGLMLRLDRVVPLEPGDRVYVGIARTRRHALLHADEMVEATVVRAGSMAGGETLVAVHFPQATPAAHAAAA
ncbi:MAG: PilZ domain-containing protein [Phycisphaerales bacterium]|nr:PilZ domain-containing protein [Phycisphaerales bacterium]NNM27238.1 PilZ domain-containing protein [Phycisphaerales bacterium]